LEAVDKIKLYQSLLVHSMLLIIIFYHDAAVV